GTFRIGLIGERADLTYPYEYLGAGGQSLASVVAGAGEFASAFREAKKPLLILGRGALTSEGGLAQLALAAKAANSFGLVREGWNGFSVLSATASLVGGLDIGFVPGNGAMSARAMAKEGALDCLYLLGADAIDIAPGAFVIYQGTHGDRGAHRADVILPGAAYTEKSGTYVNTEGRVQMGDRAVFPPGDARDDWAILRGLSGALGKALPFDSLGELRKVLYGHYPHLAGIGAIARQDAAAAIAAMADLDVAGSDALYAPSHGDYYLSNAIARASRVMAQCSELARSQASIAAE
ncbi:MAG: molybdopterin-dependent oxidoreductase, partial [Hyphomicrobiales bacterium]|nr:molybdopterin-dependent oxidoreductase [Hyphomicrobiales bacterium]